MTDFNRLPVWALGLALAGSLTLPSPARGDRLDGVSVLGAPAAVTVAGPGDVAVVGFLLAPSDTTKVTIKVKVAKKQPLVLDVRLLRPDGTVFDPATAKGKAKLKARSYSAKFVGVTTPGLWRVEVRGQGDTEGDCAVTVKAKEKAKLKGTAVVPAGGGVDVPFDAPANGEISVKLKRGKGAAVVPVPQLLDPNGNPVDLDNLVKTKDKSGSASFKKVRLPLYGLYVLRVRGQGGGGGIVSYSIALKQKKFKGDFPVADPGPAFAVEPGTEGRLDGSPSTGGNQFHWAQVSGSPVDLSDPTSPFPTFTAPEQPGSLGFELVLGSNGVFSRGTPFAVEVGERPVADGGRSASVDGGAAVVLDGSASLDRAARGLRFSWRQIDGPAVTLDDPAAATPSFDAPAAGGVLRFGLVVDDGNSVSPEDQVVVSVGDPLRAVADAGRVQVTGRMATVHLSALASVRPGDHLGSGLAWTQLSGPNVVLDEPDGFAPAFTAPRQTSDLTFQLTVDGNNATADRVTVHVRALETNVAGRTVGSGPLTFASGAVPMDAQSSVDPDGDPFDLRWSQVGGPPVPLAGSDLPVATATIPDVNEVYQFAVQGFDGLQYAAPDVITVTRIGFSGRPLANAGANGLVNFPGAVQLDGSTSTRTDGGPDPITFLWEQVSGTDWFDVAALDGGFDPTAPVPTVTLPEGFSSLTPERTLTFRLTVDDGVQDSLPDLVTVEVVNIPLNGVPIVTADADDTNPVAAATVRLSATAQDLDGDPLTFGWTQTSGPPVNLSPGPNSLTPQFLAPDAGTLVFEFTADDGFDTSPPATVQVVVDERPVADVTVTPESGDPGTAVTMDGTVSSDPEGRPLTFRWTQTAGPQQNIDPTNGSLSFNSPADAVTFSLVVNDGRQDSVAKVASFSSAPPPDPSPTASLASAPYGASVTLRANPDGGSAGLTFVWRQINPADNDPAVTLSNTNAENPTFSVPLPTNLPFGTAPQATFGVVVSNGEVNSDEATVKVTFFASLNSGSTLRTVMGVVSSRCTSCHSGSNNSCPVGSGGNATGYGMSSKNAFRNNSINKNSCGSGKSRVVPNNGGSSYFLDRLKGIGGTQMPTSGGPIGTTDRNLIEDWINQGAKDN